MAEARKPQSIDGWTEKVDSDRKKRGTRRKLQDQTFEQLSSKEKDRLLKAIAIRLGFIAASDDEEEV